MSAAPSHPEPATDDARATERDADTAYYRAVLHELIEIGATLARTLPQQATQPPAPEAAPTPATTADLAAAYERLTRALRRTIALARALDQPAPHGAIRPLTTRHTAPRTTPPDDTLDDDDAPGAPPDLPPEHLRAARAHVAREVEAAIEHDAHDHADAAALRADLHERLDHPDFAWDVAERPIETIIADLCLNLGISDIADLRAWAARTAELSPIAASPRPAHRGTAPNRTALATPHPDQHRPTRPLTGLDAGQTFQRRPSRYCAAAGATSAIVWITSNPSNSGCPR